MTTMQYESGLPGAVATPELVGREEILELAQRCLEQAGQGPQFIFLIGEGGIGKTRLLHALLQLLSVPGSGYLTASQIVDLYDIPNHTPEELIDTIRREGRFPRESFKKYEEEYSKLERMRLAGGVHGISEQRKNLYSAFLKDLRALNEEKRVIIALDTAERLVYFPDQKDTSELAPSWHWLLENIDSLGNVTFLIAGRAPAKILKQTLEGKEARHDEIEIGPFTEQESLDYFAAVLEACLRLSETGTARKIQGLTPNNRLIAHLLSGGRPILLSLLVDYLIPANRLDLPTAMQTTVQDVVRMPEEERKKVQEDFEKQLISYLIENSGYGDEIRAIGRAPKGIDCRLLSKILQVTETQAELILEKMHRFSFIKVRSGGRYFFHDELYEMLKRHVYSMPLDIAGKVQASEAIRKDYKDRYNESVQELNRLCAPVEIEGSTTWLNLEEITKIYNGRRTLLIELTYYRLRDEPLAGFQYYYRYMREALEARDLTLFLMLQAELTSYLGEPDTPRHLARYGIDREFFHSELLLYPVKHAWIEHDYENLIAECDRLLAANTLVPRMRASALAWKARGLTYRAKNGDKAAAVDILDEVISTLSQVLADDRPVDDKIDLERWYTYAVLATAYRARAYLFWIEGNLKNSIEDYQLSAPLWRLINLDVELASTLNDLGFVIAENGDPDEAHNIVTDAFEMRRDIGPRMPVSLSLNTLGIIRMREGAYNDAIQYSVRALALARALNDWRTVCLAQIAISEARRRKTFVDPLMSQDQKVHDLREARDAAKEAHLIVKGNERLREVEALIEWGCACRDWVRIRKETPSPRDNIDALIQESEEKLQEAALLAGSNMLYRKVDALVNLAWLWFYARNIAKLETAKQTAREAIPAKFFLIPGHGLPEISEGDVLVQIWTQLGKLEILEGNQKFDEYINGAQPGQAKAEDADKNQALCDAALHYSLGLEYDNLYSKNHPGLQQAKSQIYERFKKMRITQLHTITRQVIEYEKIYNIQKSTMRAFMKQWALWFEA